MTLLREARQRGAVIVGQWRNDMKQKRYIISISLLERDELGRQDLKTLSVHALYRTHNQGEARLQFDNAIGLLKQEGYSFDSDPISRGE